MEWLFLLFIFVGNLGVTAQRCLHKGEVLDLPIVLDFHSRAYISKASVAIVILQMEISALQQTYIHIDDTASPRELREPYRSRR